MKGKNKVLRINFLVVFITILFIGISNSSYAQKCLNFHKTSKCKVEGAHDFKLSSLSRSHYLEVGKTVTYEVVLYGQKEFIIQCCTEDKYYPLRFKLKSSVNGDIIYDNKYDNYINNISLSMDRTELISIEISIVSTPENINILKGTKTCVGMAIYMEKTDVRQ